MARHRVRPHVLLRGLALLASLAALGWTAQWMLDAHLLSQQWIDAEVAGHGVAGYAIFVGVGALATALGFPRQVVALFAFDHDTRPKTIHGMRGFFAQP